MLREHPDTNRGIDGLDAIDPDSARAALADAQGAAQAVRRQIALPIPFLAAIALSLGAVVALGTTPNGQPDWGDLGIGIVIGIEGAILVILRRRRGGFRLGFPAARWWRMAATLAGCAAALIPALAYRASHRGSVGCLVAGALVALAVFALEWVCLILKNARPAAGWSTRPPRTTPQEPQEKQAPGT